MRMIRCLDYGNFEPYGALFSSELLTSVWPPGHDVFFRAIFNLIQPESTGSALSIYYTVSVAVWLIGIATYVLLARRIMSKPLAWLALPILLSSPLLLSYSYSGMTEIFQFSLLGLASLLVVRVVQGHGVGDAMLAGAAMLVASAFRIESVVLAAGLFLYLVFRGRYRAALAFGPIAAALSGARIIYALAIDRDNPRNFLRFGAAQNEFPDPVILLRRMFVEQLGESEGVFLILCASLILVPLAMQIVWRRPVGDSDSATGSGAAAEFRGSEREGLLLGSLAAIGLTFIVIAILQGRITDHIRYLISMIPLVGLFSLWLSQRIAERVLQAGARDLYLIVITTACGAAMVLSLWSFVARRPQLGVAESELVGWLNRSGSGNRVYFDFLNFEEQRLMLLTRDIRTDNQSWHLSYRGALLPRLHESLKGRDSGMNGEIQTERGHQYLRSARPRYVVLATDEHYDRHISQLELNSRHLRHSYLRPYLEAGVDGRHCLASPYVDVTPCFSEVWANERYRILENPTANLLVDSNRVGEQPIWHVGGDVRSLVADVAAPRKAVRAQRVETKGAFTIAQQSHSPVAAGELVTGGIWLWRDAGEETSAILLEVGRWGSTKYEGKSKRIRLSTRPKHYTVSHRFQNPHTSFRLMIRGTDRVFYAWGAQLVRGRLGNPRRPR